ncbi:hypothetical protein M5689_013081 [Euphorbia peplus]|nr:hypothetical protein M5689_013081 [Euphorbia peplus]
MPEILLRIFALFLYGTNRASVDEMSEYSVNVVKMKWRNKDNHVDCGIYLMKHMESYEGQLESKWDIRLTKNPEDPNLKKLRIEFARRILLSPNNLMIDTFDEQSLNWSVEADSKFLLD